MTTRIYAGAAHGNPEDPNVRPGGLFRRTVGDGPWQRLAGGLPEDAEVRAIAMHPRDPGVVYAGTQHGPYRSADGGDHWTALPLPDPGRAVWSFLFDPRDPDLLYAGTAPAGVYRSRNGGESWTRLSAFRSPMRVAMSFPTRVTRLDADPARPQEIYAALEVD